MTDSLGVEIDFDAIYLKDGRKIELIKMFQDWICYKYLDEPYGYFLSEEKSISLHRVYLLRGREVYIFGQSKIGWPEVYYRYVKDVNCNLILIMSAKRVNEFKELKK